MFVPDQSNSTLGASMDRFSNNMLHLTKSCRSGGVWRRETMQEVKALGDELANWR